MSLCSLYLKAFIFLADIPLCLGYKLFNFMKYCVEKQLISAVSKCRKSY